MNKCIIYFSIYVIPDAESESEVKDDFVSLIISRLKKEQQLKQEVQDTDIQEVGLEPMDEQWWLVFPTDIVAECRNRSLQLEITCFLHLSISKVMYIHVPVSGDFTSKNPYVYKCLFKYFRWHSRRWKVVVGITGITVALLLPIHDTNAVWSFK